MQKERYYHPLSVLPKAGCIADFVINCSCFVGLCYGGFACNILDSGVSEYLTTDISNSGVGKYHVAIKTK